MAGHYFKIRQKKGTSSDMLLKDLIHFVCIFSGRRWLVIGSFESVRDNGMFHEPFKMSPDESH